MCRMEFFVCACCKVVLRFANLNIVVIPTEFFAWLNAREEFGFGYEEGYARDCFVLASYSAGEVLGKLTETATNQVNGVMM
jgi:hypothetical protein